MTASTAVDPRKLAISLQAIGWSPDQMESLLGLRLDGTVKIPADAKYTIWEIIKAPVIARKLAEIKLWFPEAKVERIR